MPIPNFLLKQTFNQRKLPQTQRIYQNVHLFFCNNTATPFAVPDSTDSMSQIRFCQRILLESALSSVYQPINHRFQELQTLISKVDSQQLWICKIFRSKVPRCTDRGAHPRKQPIGYPRLWSVRNRRFVPFARIILLFGGNRRSFGLNLGPKWLWWVVFTILNIFIESSNIHQWCAHELWFRLESCMVHVLF
jgi:hypothetical protein